MLPTSTYTRQLFQSLLQFCTVLVAELITLATVTGGPPTSLTEVYLPVLLALAAALAIFGGAKLQVGGIENEAVVVRALHSSPETGELLPGTTNADLAKPVPATLK